MKVLIVDKDGYLGFCEIDAGFLPYQTWEEYYAEKTDDNGNKLFDLSEKRKIKIYERDYDKLRKPYCKIENGAIVQDTTKLEAEQKRLQEKANKENRLAELNQYFDWFNTQAIQHAAGTITDEEWNTLLAEFKEKSAEAKSIKNALGIKTETQIRDAVKAANAAQKERVN